MSVSLIVFFLLGAFLVYLFRVFLVFLLRAFIVFLFRTFLVFLFILLFLRRCGPSLLFLLGLLCWSLTNLNWSLWSLMWLCGVSSRFLCSWCNRGLSRNRDC